MVVIVDDRARARSVKLRDCFLDYGIPTALCTSESLANFRAPVTICFAHDETSLSLMSVRAGRTALMAINISGKHMYNPDAVIYDNGIPDDVIHIATEAAIKRTGIDPFFIHLGDMQIVNEKVFFEGQYLSLTDTERMIVKHLAFGMEKYHTEMNIRKYACRECDLRKSNSSVSVHICNINKKAMAATGRKLISCRRGSGYAIFKEAEKVKCRNNKPGFIPPFV